MISLGDVTRYRVLTTFVHVVAVIVVVCADVAALRRLACVVRV